MTLAQPTDGRVAGHGADGREAVGHESGLRAHSGSRARGLAAGMAAADDDDCRGSRCAIMAGLLSRSEGSRKWEVMRIDLFHVKQRVPITSRKTFHVKQVGNQVNEEILFANTEFPEDHVEDILDVHLPPAAARGNARRPEVPLPSIPHPPRRHSMLRCNEAAVSCSNWRCLTRLINPPSLAPK